MNNALVTQSAPYSQEAEEVVLGSILIDPDQFPLVAEFLKVEDFFFIRHGYVWQAMCQLNERGDTITYLTVQESLKAANRLEELGGPPCLTHLVNQVGTSLYAELYGRLVQRAAIRRRLMMAADAIKALALNEELTLESVTMEAQTALEAVIEPVHSRETFTAAQAIHSFWDELEAGMNGELVAMPVGYRDLDEILAGGVRRGDLHIVGGRPGMGKSSLLLSMMLQMSRLGMRCVFYSLEMTINQVMMRLVAMETGLSTTLIRQPKKLSPAQYSRVTEAMERLSKLPFFIDDTPAIEPVTLKAKMKRQRFKHGLDMVFVDYLQLMPGGAKFAKGNDRTREVGFISHKLKEFAKDLNIPLLAAAQLNRDLESRQDKRPLLSDLRESGDIESDADVVIFPYRDVVYNEATEFPNQADLIIAKNRNGPTGTVSLYYDKSITKFSDTATRRVDLDDDYTPPPSSKTIYYPKAAGASHAALSQPGGQDE